MPQSPIRMLAPYAEQARKNGIHIYQMNIGQPDIKTPQIFWDKLKDLDMDVLAYGPSNGFEGLRTAYCKYFTEKCGIADLTVDDLLITTGASEALFFTFLTILDENDNIVIPEPLYANYIGYARSGNINIKPIETKFEDNFALPSIEEFEDVIDNNTKAILVCNPNNPTGYLYNKDELERLKSLAVKHNLFIISDEVYKAFNYTDEAHHSLLTIRGLEEHAILVDSFSKKFSACGARIGVVASKNKQFMSAILKFAQQRLCPPSLSQIAGEGLFELEDDFFEEARQEYIARRDTLVAKLREIDGVEVNTPNGAFYCMVRLPIDNAVQFCKWMLSDFNLNGKTIMMAPGEGFYASEGKGKNEVRIAYVLNREDIASAMECLKAGLTAYKSR